MKGSPAQAFPLVDNCLRFSYSTVTDLARLRG